jgi:hypothetical protein
MTPQLSTSALTRRAIAVMALGSDVAAAAM